MQVPLFFKTKGSGKPFLFVHGFLGSGDNWQTMSKRFSMDFQVILPDMRNHGRSTHIQENSYSAMSSDIKGLFDKLGLESAILLGHSMGGKAVMQFAIDYPDLCKAIIVIDSRPSRFSGGHEKYIDALNDIQKQKAKTRKELDVLLSQVVPEMGVRQFLLKNFKRNQEGEFILKANITLLQKEYAEVLKEISSPKPCLVPALFIRAGLSNYIGLQDEEDILRLFPNSQIKTVENAGHWIHVDRPIELFEYINEFIRSIKNFE